MQLARLRAARMATAAAHAPLARAARRAMHELELAKLDLRAAQGRRRVAVGQLECARVGALGVAYAGVGLAGEV